MRSRFRRKILLLLLIVGPVLVAMVWLHPAVGARYLFDPHPDVHTTSPVERTADHLRVLYIGNSLTFAHGGQAYILEKLVQSARLRDPSLKPIFAEHVIKPGASLEDLWRTGKPQQRIAEGNWDYIVIQDYSKQPMAAPAKMAEFVGRFAAAVKAVGAKCVLYETWAVASRPQDQSIITQAYQQGGMANRVIVLPVGRTWWDVMQQHTELQLHDADGRHPTPAGSYLTACMFYSLLYGQSPEGLTANIADQGVVYIDLSASLANLLQSAAFHAVRDVATASVPLPTLK